MAATVIEWKPEPSLGSTGGWSDIGHGLCVYSGKSGDHRARLAAFVERFAWLHGPVEVSVRFDPRHVLHGGKELDAFKRAVEDRGRHGDLTENEIIPGIFRLGQCVKSAAHALEPHAT